MDPSSDTDNDIAGVAAQAGGILQSHSLKSSLVSGATGKAAQSVEEWLNQFGTAKVSVSANENLSLEDIAIDVLVPFYDDKTNLIFTQLGSRRSDDRNIINTGLGYRHFSDDWMWGVNTFYDRQISTNHHQRLGLGGELGWDNLKVSANGYLRLSDWMASSRYEDYEERAANGFDIRAEGYLPAYPQLGASVMYEQYFGHNVDLFNDEDNRQKDPYAVTVGLNYTPFTLMTAGVSQKMGKGDTQDTQFNLSFNYALSVSLDKQLDPSQVAVRRSLLGSRQDLVNRNNNIVLEYRKQDLISLGLPEKIEGVENSTLPIPAVINSKYSVERIDWQADDLIAHGGAVTQDKHSSQYSITLPKYQYGGADNHYTVSGKAFDTKGNSSNLSEMNVYVSGYNTATWQTTTSATPSTLPADGTSTSTVTVKILNENSQSVTGVASQLSATVKLTPSVLQGTEQSSVPVQNATVSGFKETSPGTYISTFTSGNVAGTAEVIPQVNGQTTLPSAEIRLQSIDTSASLSSLVASKTSALADGVDSIQLTAKVLTVEGQPYKGVTVSWAADNAEVKLSSTQSESDENGLVTVNVSSLSVLSTTVSAHLDTGESLNSDALGFGADMVTAQVVSISADKMQAVADNSDKVTLTANIVNAQNQPLTGVAVDWNVEQGSAVLSAQQGTTDSSGHAQVTLASTIAGDVVVSAHSGTTEAKNTDVIKFSADTQHMSISSLTSDKTQALANGNDTVTYLVTVTDANGNKVEGAPVTWSSDSAAATLSASTVNTDAQGQASIHVTSTVAGNMIVSAQLAEGSASPAPVVSFSADATTAHLSEVQADKTQVLANGNDKITLTTTLEDANGNPLANTDINWSITPANGTLSASSTQTDAQGMATVTLSSTVVGNYTVTASSGNTSSASPSLVFIADVASAYISSLSANKTADVVAGVDSVTMKTLVLDANGHPVPNVTVNWSSDNSSGQFAPVSGLTDANGEATTQFTETQAQKTVITATITGSSKTQPIDVIANAGTAKLSAVTSSKAQALANGTDTVTWTVTVKDANQNPVGNMVVNWSSDNANITLSGNSTQTSASGVATVTATSTKTADAVVTAALTTPAGSASASKVSYIADASTTQMSTVTADKTQALANGTDLITLSTTLTDINGNPLVNTDVSWNTSPATGTLSAGSTKTDAQGKATVTLSATEVADYTVTAQANGVSKTSPTLSFTSDAATAHLATLVADKTAGVVAGKDTVTLTATVLDANNHPVSGAAVNWSSDNNSGQFTPVSGVTDGNGVATTQFTETKAQTTLITATAAGGSKTQSVDVIADVATAQVKTVVADKSQALANGTDVITWSATVVDANQNPVTNMAVNWSSDNANITLSGSSTQTNANGVATVTATSTKTADAVVTAALTTPAGSASASKVNYIADTSTTQLSAVTADKTQALANGTDLITLSTTVTDINGNPLVNTNVSWSTSPTTGQLSSGSTKTDAQGKATVTLSSLAVSQYAVTALANGVSANSPALTFIADAATAHLATLVADKTTAVVAGKDTVTLTATVLDSNNHPVPDAIVTWSSDNSNGNFTTVSGNTDASGIATATYIAKTAQTTVITATTGTDSKTQSLEVIADVSTAALGAVTSDKTQALANGTEVVTWSTTVKDANQNPVGNMAVNWSSDNANITLSGNSTQTSASGVATVTATSTKTADAVVTAALTTPAGSASASKVSYIADASTTQMSTVTADKTQALANGTDLITLSTTLTDINGNPLANTDVSWSTTPGAGTLSDNTTKTDAQGKATVTLSSVDTGSYTVTAMANSISANSPALVFTADVATAQISTLNADKVAGVVAGVDTITLQATVLDANNHPVPNVAVNWSSDNASGVITPVSGVTNTEGVATATLTSTLAQTTVITASTANNQKTLSADIIANAQTAVVTVESDKTQATANGTDTVTWKATLRDDNNNPIIAGNVDWGSSNAGVTLDSSSSQTDADGITTMTGTSLKSGNAIMTVTLTPQQRSGSATAVMFVADTTTAKITSVTPDKTRVEADNSSKVTYTAVVVDANNNVLPDATVNWSTEMLYITDKNTLSATSSVTDDQGKATVQLLGPYMGKAFVGAQINNSNMSSSTVVTFTHMDGYDYNDWDITGTSSAFSASAITQFKTIGFVTRSPSTGAASVIDGYTITPSDLTTPMTDEQGHEVTVNFKGMRVTGCFTTSFNSTASCQVNSTTAHLTYAASDNPDLAPGVYHGKILYSGQDVGPAIGVVYKSEIAVTLTVD